jgi:hypothetical protein
MSSDKRYLIPVSSITLLLIFDMDGKQQHTYQYDSNKHRLFTVPYRITTKKKEKWQVSDINNKT